MPSDQYYVYNSSQPLTEHEQKIKQSGARLTNHYHHSDNTHLIVSGSLGISYTACRDPAISGYGKPLVYGPGEEVLMPAMTNYVGQAGPEGCVYVEGHKCLSPTTAKRFVHRGTFVKAQVDDEGSFTPTEYGHLGRR